VTHVSADQVERLVIDAVHKQLRDRGTKLPGGNADAGAIARHTSPSGQSAARVASGKSLAVNGVHTSFSNAFHDKDFVRAHLRRVDVHTDHLVVAMTLPDGRNEQAKAVDVHRDKGGTTQVAGKQIVVRIPWTKRPVRVARKIIAPAKSQQRPDTRPIRAETRAKLVTAIAEGRRWLNELVTGTVTSAQEIADRRRCSIRQVNRAITLAFLSPKLVEAAMEGRLPRGIGVATIRHLPAEWSKQHSALGLKF
jgi:hypothetical protein